MPKQALQLAFERLGACYCIFWSSHFTGGQTFEVIADYVRSLSRHVLSGGFASPLHVFVWLLYSWQTTDSFACALKNARGDDMTFCTVSRTFKPDAAGNGPVATAARTGKKIFYDDLLNARLRRSRHAKEFDIKAMGLVPIDGGVRL